MKTSTKPFQDINMLWSSSLHHGVDIAKLWPHNMKSWLIWQRKMMSSSDKLMPQSQKKSLKHTKFKVTQQSSSSLMESKSITEVKEQQTKCTDG